MSPIAPEGLGKHADAKTQPWNCWEQDGPEQVEGDDPTSEATQLVMLA